MAVVRNNSARQYNLKRMEGGRRVLVRLVPGLNIVADVVWSKFVAKKGDKVKLDPYVAKLEKDGEIAFGERLDEMELTDDGIPEAVTKDTPLPKNKPNMAEK